MILFDDRMVSSPKPVPIFLGRGSKKFNSNVGLFSFICFPE